LDAHDLAAQRAVAAFAGSGRALRNSGHGAASNGSWRATRDGRICCHRQPSDSLLLPTAMRVPIALKSIAVAMSVAAVFVGVSVLAQAHQDALRHIVGVRGAWGIAAFILLTAAFVVFLIPLDVS